MQYSRFTIFAIFFAAVLVAPLSYGFAQGLESLARTAGRVGVVEPEKLEPASGAAPEVITTKQETDTLDKNVESDVYSYVLGADDIIKVTVYGENDLSSTYKIGSAGMISFPLIGEINVEGQSTRQVEHLLQSRLSDGYLINPSVSVEVASYRPFYILGEVRNPGSYDFTSGATILKAVALAGGFTYRANKKEVQVLKTKESGSDLYEKVSVNTAIGPGDIILVKERFF